MSEILHLRNISNKKCIFGGFSFYKVKLVQIKT